MVDLLGYAASFAVLMTFLMRTMLPLRLIAILSNVLFISYGYIAHVHPVFVLHMALLPINAVQLMTFRDRRKAPNRILVRALTTAHQPETDTAYLVAGTLVGGMVAIVILNRLGLI